MEAIPMPLTWSEFPEIVRDVFRGFRSPAGEDMVLRDNIFVEQLLPGGGDSIAYGCGKLP
jgi:haloalkane dehalogenase